MELELERIYDVRGTSGTIRYYGKKICESIELPWRKNVRNVSCIPEGRYRLATQIHPVKGKQLLICDVPGRAGILIHAANDAEVELRGCIAPVSKVTAPGKGLYSRIATERLEDLVIPVIDAKEEVWLVVKGLSPGLQRRGIASPQPSPKEREELLINRKEEHEDK